MDGSDEVDVLHGSGDDVAAGVAVGGHGADEVDEVHEAAAEQIAQGVGIVGQDQLGHFRLRLGHGARGKRGAVQVHGDLLVSRVQGGGHRVQRERSAFRIQRSEKMESRPRSRDRGTGGTND